MDPSNDYQFLNEILGKAVKITLKCGIFQGILQHVDSSRSIVLSRVKNLETGRSMAGVKMFFGYEIVNVELLEELEQDAARGAATPIRDSLVTGGTGMDRGEPAEHSPQSSTCISPESRFTTLSNLKYTLAEEEEEENMEYIVIDQFQQKFGPAISCMELPEELQQLADFQKLRREKALKKYKVNEEGLLIRPPLESKGKKAAEVEEKQGEDSCWLSSNGAALQKTSFHPQDPLHQNDDEQKQVVDHWENKKSRIGYKNPSFEMEAGARDLVSWNSVSENTQAMGKGFSPEQKPHTQAAGSLQEERSLLFTGNQDEDLFCAKHSTIVSASTPPKIRNSLQDSFQVPRQPSLSVLPPCPVLETVGLWQNPSLKMTQTYISNFPVRPEREGSSAVRFAFPSGLSCRMPAPSPAGK
uniref:Exonuclease 3'-5' domain containing 1 n=1 Tax=Terrapene triunguis TaxID=2587831 RepID=A0A674JGM6_9SAUR